VDGIPIIAPTSGSIVPPKVTPVIKSDIVPKDSPNKLPPICDTSRAIELGSDRFTFQLGEVDSSFVREITGE